MSTPTTCAEQTRSVISRNKSVKYNAYPEKNCAHWTKVSPRMHSNRGLPSVRISRRGFRLEMKYGTVMAGGERRRLGCVLLPSMHQLYNLRLHATISADQDIKQLDWVNLTILRIHHHMRLHICHRELSAHSRS